MTKRMIKSSKEKIRVTREKSWDLNSLFFLIARNKKERKKEKKKSKEKIKLEKKKCKRRSEDSPPKAWSWWHLLKK